MIDSFSLIIGSMKSGTTSLFNHLAQHPEIAPCKYKEPHFFSQKNQLEKGFAYYQSLWNWNNSSHKIALEASAGYTAYHQTPLANQNPNRLYAADSIVEFKNKYPVNFKFIYLMRNPIERLESHYNHTKAWEYHNKEIPKEKLDMMIDGSKYAMQINQYYQRFPKNSLLLLNFDDLVNNPEMLMEKVCRFLEVDPTYKFSNLKTNHNPHQRKKRIVIPGWYLLRKKVFMQSLSRSIPTKVKYSFRNLFGNKVNKEYKKFSEVERQYILSKISDDLRKLHQEYEFDTSSWSL